MEFKPLQLAETIDDIRDLVLLYDIESDPEKLHNYLEVRFRDSEEAYNIHIRSSTYTKQQTIAVQKTNVNAANTILKKYNEAMTELFCKGFREKESYE